MPRGTVKLHRVLRASPERLYRAFLDADAMAKWLPSDGFTGKVHHLEPRKGGTYRKGGTGSQGERGHISDVDKASIDNTSVAGNHAMIPTCAYVKSAEKKYAAHALAF